MGSVTAGFDRTVVLASADAALRQRLSSSLSGLRWKVREARGGAEAIAQLEGQPTEALLLDHWLPDLEVGEFAEQIGTMFPGMDLLRVDGDPILGGARSPRRHELLYALREALGAANRQDSTDHRHCFNRTTRLRVNRRVSARSSSSRAPLHRALHRAPHS
jgi:hypothetical protein